MAIARSAIRTCRAPASASEKTATVRMPSRRAVRIMRQTISPRFAIRTDENIPLTRRAPRRAARESQKRAAGQVGGRHAVAGVPPEGGLAHKRHGKDRVTDG